MTRKSLLALALLFPSLIPTHAAGPLISSISANFTPNSNDGSVLVYGTINPPRWDYGTGNGYLMTIQTYQANGTSWICAFTPTYVWDPNTQAYFIGTYSIRIPGEEGFVRGDSVSLTLYYYDAAGTRYYCGSGSGTY